jgi:hypothetical protein
MYKSKRKPEPTAWMATPTGLFVACGTGTALGALSALSALRLLRLLRGHVAAVPAVAAVAVAARGQAVSDLREAETNLHVIQNLLWALDQAKTLGADGMGRYLLLKRHSNASL